MINIKKYMAYASLGAMMMGGMNQTAQGIAKDEDFTQIVITKQAPTREQKEWYSKLKKEPDFKTFPKELAKKIKDNLGGAEKLKSHGKIYDIVIFPVDEGTGIGFDLLGNAPRVFFYKTRVYEKDIIPTYPRSAKAIAMEEEAKKYGTLKWFQMPQGIDELPAEQAREVKLFYKQVDDNFHYLYTAPFPKIDIKKLKKGDYNGMIIPSVDLIDWAFTLDKEDRMKYKIARALKAPLSLEQILKYSENKTHSGGRCDLYGSCSFGDMGPYQGTGAGIIHKATWKLNDWQADTIKKQFLYIEKKGRKLSLTRLTSDILYYIKDKVKVPKNLLEEKADTSGLTPYQKAFLPIYHQMKGYRDTIINSKKLEEDTDYIEGAVIDVVPPDRLRQPEKISHQGLRVPPNNRFNSRK